MDLARIETIYNYIHDEEVGIVDNTIKIGIYRLDVGVGVCLYLIYVIEQEAVLP